MHQSSANMKFFDQLWCARVYSRHISRRGSVRYLLNSNYRKKSAQLVS